MWRRFGCRARGWGAAAFSFILVGCAARPGPEVLTPVAASSGEKALQIYVATTRERESLSGNVFTANRANALNCSKWPMIGAAGRLSSGSMSKKNITRLGGEI